MRYLLRIDRCVVHLLLLCGAVLPSALCGIEVVARVALAACVPLHALIPIVAAGTTLKV